MKYRLPVSKIRMCVNEARFFPSFVMLLQKIRLWLEPKGFCANFSVSLDRRGHLKSTLQSVFCFFCFYTYDSTWWLPTYSRAVSKTTATPLIALSLLCLIFTLFNNQKIQSTRASEYSPWLSCVFLSYWNSDLPIKRRDKVERNHIQIVSLQDFFPNKMARIPHAA